LEKLIALTVATNLILAHALQFDLELFVKSFLS